VPRFVRSCLIGAPVERVFAFHEREDALDLLSPSFPRIRLLARRGGLETGAKVEMEFGAGPFRFLWIALHTAYEKDRLFVDEQIYGPFSRWVHRHEFEAHEDGTRLTDRVEFSLMGGALVDVLFGWAVRIGLWRMFRHRHRVTARLCEE
jgi:ligand-binding SRPBCC domain-containing protein